MEKLTKNTTRETQAFGKWSVGKMKRGRLLRATPYPHMQGRLEKMAAFKSALRIL
jgi:hypothetical protein